MTGWGIFFSIIRPHCSVFLFFFLFFFFCFFFFFFGGGAVAQSVERTTPGEEVSGSIPAVAARSLPVGSVLV